MTRYIKVLDGSAMICLHLELPSPRQQKEANKFRSYIFRRVDMLPFNQQ